MKVSKDKVVSMHYTLKNDAGEVIDSSDGKETLDFLQGHGNIIPGLESHPAYEVHNPLRVPQIHPSCHPYWRLQALTQDQE